MFQQRVFWLFQELCQVIQQPDVKVLKSYTKVTTHTRARPLAFGGFLEHICPPQFQRLDGCCFSGFFPASETLGKQEVQLDCIGTTQEMEAQATPTKYVSCHLATQLDLHFKQ